MNKILIVDDEKNVLTLYHDLLSHHGFNVLTANNAEAGLSLAIAESPDLILLDVMMPGTDGTEASVSLMENDRTKNIPVIFLTNIVTDDEVKRTGGNIGGRMFLSKTSGTKEIVKKVKEVLSAKGR